MAVPQKKKSVLKCYGVSAYLRTYTFVHVQLYHSVLIFVKGNWRASEASETLIGLNNGNRRYIYILREASL